MSAPRSSMTLGLYGLATGLAEPLAPLLLSRRLRRGKEDAERLGERLGRASRSRPDGALVWLHGASVGESVSLLPLVARIGAERPYLRLLVTSGTRTSADLLGQRLPAGVIHQYVPIDAPAAVARFLDHWRPSLGLFVESELWPNLILGAQKRDAKLALVSARMSAASARGWARRPAAAHAVLDAFDTIFAQDTASEERLTALGGTVAGRLNLKRLGAPLEADARQVAALKAAVGARRVIFAASTHAGEEIAIAAAASTLPDHPLLIIAPRHPERGAAVAAELGKAGVELARRSQGSQPEGRTAVYLADTLGEMGLFYRLADAVVIGGGFAAGVGGHNPLEAARLGVGVVSGPRVFNHADIYDEMVAAGAAAVVDDTPDLAATLARLLDPKASKALGDAARAFAGAQGQALESAWPKIAALLPAP